MERGNITGKEAAKVAGEVTDLRPIKNKTGVIPDKLMGKCLGVNQKS